MAGIAPLRQKTELADSTGVTPWNGTNGVKAQITDITDLLLARGMYPVSDLNALALLNGADAIIAQVAGIGIFYFDANATGTLPSSSVLAAGGGQWRLVGVTPPAPYERVIGDASSTSFVLPHNQNVLLPNVEVWDITNPLAQTRVQRSEYNVVSDGSSLNSITITQTGSAWAGNSKRVIIKAY